MTPAISLIAVLLAANDPLRVTVTASAVEIDGKNVFGADPKESIGQLESALIPARGKSALFRVEEGVNYARLFKVLNMAGAVGVEQMELEHGDKCRHVLPGRENKDETEDEDNGPKFPLFTVALAKKGYFIALVKPSSSDGASKETPRSKESPGKPTFPLVKGAYPASALLKSLRDFAPKSPELEVIIASEEDLSALEVLRTWDVVTKEPRVKKVILAWY